MFKKLQFIFLLFALLLAWNGRNITITTRDQMQQTQTDQNNSAYMNMKLFKIFLLITLFYITAFASPAIRREITFTQPDGTTVKGQLHGDASFHWIESNGDVVIYNSKDK